MPADTPRPPSGRLRRALRALSIAAGVLTVVAVVNTAFTSTSAGATEATTTTSPDRDRIERGREIFGARCALCHGENGRGIEGTGPARGPSLVGVGPASVDFMIRTGRMPIHHADERLQRRPPAFDDEERKALIAYVESLAPGEGPEIPEVGDDWQQASLSEGMELFTTHCAACHGPTAQGIAVGQEDVSSSLDVASPLEIAEAIRVGPGVMPLFGEDVLSEHETEAILAWIMHLRERGAPGGAQIGRTGPVSEGLVAWVVGLGLLTVVMYLLGEKSSGDDDVEA